jgi:hypothetical protein
VRVTLTITTAVIASFITSMMVSLGPPARISLSILPAQTPGPLAWFTAYLWWVLHRRPSPRLS